MGGFGNPGFYNIAMYAGLWMRIHFWRIQIPFFPSADPDVIFEFFPECMPSRYFGFPMGDVGF